MIARFRDEWGRGAFRAMCRGRLWMPRTDRQRDGAFLSRVEVGGQPTVGAEGAIDPKATVVLPTGDCPLREVERTVANGFG